MTKRAPAPPSPSRLERASALKSLIALMVARAHTPLQPPPVGEFLADPSKLARESAASAVSIANSCADLGQPGQDNQQLAANLWTETLAQIERVQKLHGLPPLPFQRQPAPPGPSTDA